MDLLNFIQNIAEQFEDIDTSNFNSSTKFRENDEYSSLTGMSIIAMVDEKYNVRVSGSDIRSVHTIEELFNLISSKK